MISDIIALSNSEPLCLCFLVFLSNCPSVWPVCLSLVVRSGDYYLFETDSEEEDEEEKKEDEEKEEELPEKSAFQVSVSMTHL